MQHRTEAAARQHWLTFDHRTFDQELTVDDAWVEAHAADRMEWKVVVRRRWWHRPAYRGRRGVEFHSPDGEWIVRHVRIDKWRRSWQACDRRGRPRASLAWGSAEGSRRFVEGYGRRHRLCCCPATPIDREPREPERYAYAPWKPRLRVQVCPNANSIQAIYAGCSGTDFEAAREKAAKAGAVLVAVSEKCWMCKQHPGI